MKNKLILSITLLSLAQVAKPEITVQDVADIASVSLIPAVVAGGFGLKYWSNKKAEECKKQGDLTISQRYSTLGKIGKGLGIIGLIALTREILDITRITEELREAYFWVLRRI